MAYAQGIFGQLIYKKQSAKGTAASGSGGQILRRETATFQLNKDTFEADEIVSHQQDTGVAYGVGKVDGSINGVLSPGTYSALAGSLLRSDFAAVSAITGLSLTIAGSGPYTLTRATGDFLTGGIKIGDIVRITAGTYTGTARDINLLVTGVTSTVLTVAVVNGSSLTAQGPVASSTVTVIGKKSKVPTTGHTNDYYTFERWQSDVSRSRTYTDCQIAKIDLGLPSTGNATVQIGVIGLGETKGASQVLTSPTSETSTAILAAVNGYLLIGGNKVVSCTSMSVSIDGQVQHGEAVVGSKVVTDVIRGDVKVTGSFTVIFEDETLSNYFTNESAIQIVAVITADASATSDFVTINMSRVKVTSDAADDGKKQIIRTYNFVAEINGSGGASLANDQTIVTIQDSAA